MLNKNTLDVKWCKTNKKALVTLTVTKASSADFISLLYPQCLKKSLGILMGNSVKITEIKLYFFAP